MRLKAKFRPNLAAESNSRNRARQVSGSAEAPTKRIRTVSTGSSHEDAAPPASQSTAKRVENEPIQNIPPPPGSPKKLAPTHRIIEPGHGLFTPLLPGDTAPTSPIHRQRRNTESSSSVKGDVTLPQPASVFDKRRADHKKKFTSGIPERTKMTMFDLIYYNPQAGHRMSTSSSRRTSRASMSSSEEVKADDAIVPDQTEIRKRIEEEEVDDVQDSQSPEKTSDQSSPQKETEEEEDDKMPVPQVKVGPNGELIIDEESTLIETTAAKKAKEDILESPLVFENGNQTTNHGSWGKKRKNVDWSDGETIRFYKALSVFGTDFSMMESIFKKRTRHELKMKFKKEERTNRALVDKCLKEGMQFDTSIFNSDSEEELAKEKIPKRRRKIVDRETKLKKRRARRIRSSRGYYSSSDEADESEVDDDARRNSQTEENQTRVTTRRRQTVTARESTALTTSSPLLQSLLTKPQMDRSEKPSFPPGLLAANPDLANALPGSLVVVASPAENDPQRQMLHVYRVGDDQGDKSKEAS